jgi:hypothetical protein
MRELHGAVSSMVSMAKTLCADGVAGQARKAGNRKLYIESQAHKCLHYR